MELLREAECLRNVPMFAKLEPAKLKLLAFTSESTTFEDGEVLFHAGDPADCAYLIMEGEVDILAETDAGEYVVATLGKNRLFGELGIFNNAPRNATLRAKGHLEALRIADDMFLRLVTENPEVALDVMRQLSEKLNFSHKQFETAQRKLQHYEGRPPA